MIRFFILELTTFLIGHQSFAKKDYLLIAHSQRIDSEKIKDPSK